MITIIKVHRNAVDVVTHVLTETYITLTKAGIVAYIRKGGRVQSRSRDGVRADVHILRLEHIRTESDGITSNNLDNLPTFIPE